MTKNDKQIIQKASDYAAGKLALSDDAVADLCDSLNRISANASPWWVILLKVLAYTIGLILGGVATTSCSHLIF